jgi:hypothetical protein
MGFSSCHMEQWLTSVHSVSAEDPCFSTIDTLMDTTGEGIPTAYVPVFILKTHRPLQSPAEGSCITWQARRRQESHGILCERLFASAEPHLIDQYQDNLFGPIRNCAVIAGQNESEAKHTREEVKARYIDWVAQKDKAPSVRISIFLDVFRQDHRKHFDEACQCLGCVFARNLTPLAARSLKKRCCDLHATRSSFTNQLSRDIDVR